MTDPAHATGTIRADELVSLSEFRRRFHLGEHFIRQFRKNGLRLVRFGREDFLLGRDVIGFFERLGEQQAAGDEQILEGQQ